MNEMFFILYAPVMEGSGSRFRGLMESMNITTEVYRKLSSLSARLRHSIHGIKGMVIVLLDHKDLIEVYGIRNLLADIPILLILPDHAKESISMGNAIHPRFMTYWDSEPEEVTIVLNRMLANIREN